MSLLTFFGILAATVLTQSLQVPTNDLNLYDQSIFIPYTSTFSSSTTPSVRGGINDSDFTFPVDTGSVGVMMGATLLPGVDVSTPEWTQYPLGWKFKASTSLLYTGRFLPMNITFYGAGRDEAVSQVDVLVVDNVVHCSTYDTILDTGSCSNGATKPSSLTLSSIINMGVGFGLASSSFNTPGYNPFLALHSLNGQPPSSLRTGYTLSTAGVTLGLTTANTLDTSWIALSRGSSLNTSFRINNVASATFSGTAVIDTSTAATTIQSSALLAGAPPLTPGYVRRLGQGSKLEFAFPTFETGVAGYDFAVGDAVFPSQPEYVDPVVGTGGDVFVRMGRGILWGFEVAFDAGGARIGFICRVCV